jgi:hypothetical protein
VRVEGASKFVNKLTFKPLRRLLRIASGLWESLTIIASNIRVFMFFSLTVSWIEPLAFKSFDYVNFLLVE